MISHIMSSKLHELIIVFALIFNATQGRKRLLLDNQDVLSRLSNLEALVTQQNAEIKQQRDILQQQVDTIKRQGEEIANLTSLNEGYVGGGASNETGSSPDFVCLPPDPKLRATKIDSYDYGRMYGVEYGTNFWGMHPNPIYEEIPCAVCNSNHVTTTIMIPGKDTCYSGWKREYHGYLGSSHHSHTSGSSFICVDSNHQSISGGHLVHQNSKVVVNVKAHCGSLRCPPYTDGYSFTCVVCSK